LIKGIHIHGLGFKFIDIGVKATVVTLRIAVGDMKIN